MFTLSFALRTFLRMVSMYFLSGWLYLMDSLTFLTSYSRTDVSVKTATLNQMFVTAGGCHLPPWHPPGSLLHPPSPSSAWMPWSRSWRASVRAGRSSSRTEGSPPARTRVTAPAGTNPRCWRQWSRWSVARTWVTHRAGNSIQQPIRRSLGVDYVFIQPSAFNRHSMSLSCLSLHRQDKTKQKKGVLPQGPLTRRGATQDERPHKWAKSRKWAGMSRNKWRSQSVPFWSSRWWRSLRSERTTAWRAAAAWRHKKTFKTQKLSMWRFHEETRARTDHVRHWDVQYTTLQNTGMMPSGM